MHHDTEPAPLVATAPQCIDMEYGREARVLPTANIGEFRTPVSRNIALESFSVETGMAHVPVLSKANVRVTSRLPKHPVISSKSTVVVFSRYNKVHGLPKHIETVLHPDATLPLIRTILEHDLNGMGPESQLSAFVSEFEVETSRNAEYIIHRLCLF